jgi:glycosyltransferase involved in cell wall biosynthesis
MISDYQRNTDQLGRLRHYAAIVTFSSHMKSEFVKHQIPGPRVLLIPPFTPRGDERRRLPLLEPHTTLPPLAARNEGTALGYLGRLERGKGLSILLDALPRVSAVLGRPLTLRIAGAGSGRAKVGSRAHAVTSANPDIRIVFDEWLPDDRHDEFFAAIDLLVIPSVWPEPFSLVGLEAGAHGVPTAGFEVGGIPDWLIDGTNGHLAKGPRPTKDRLAEAIVACLSDIDHYARLRQGAHEIATAFSPGAHINSLLRLFQNVAIAPS